MHGVQEGRSLGHATKSQGWGQGNQYPGHMKARAKESLQKALLINMGGNRQGFKRRL